MAFIDSIYEKAKALRGRVAIPECCNETMMAAAIHAAREGVADIVFVGDPAEIRAVAEHSGQDLSPVSIVDVTDASYRAALLERYAALPAQTLRPKSVAKRMVSPLYTALVMEAVGEVGCTFGGLDTTTYEFVMAVNGVIGLAEGCVSPSGLLMLEVAGFDGPQGNIFGCADGAINTEPSAEQLAGIAVSCCDTFRTLMGREAKCAFLSYSTCGSGNSPSVLRVREGMELAKAQRPDLLIDGEFQADAAIIPRVAAKKVPYESAVAGHADVLIFPDAAACNIATKLVQYLAKARSYGPIYQGFRLPVLDCSRGDTAERIYDNIAICSVLGARGGAR